MSSRKGTDIKSRLLSPGLASLVVLVVAAFMTRLLPLAISPYPFNNDSITESIAASRILASGHLMFAPDPSSGGGSMTVTPVLNVLLAFFAAGIGTTTDTCAQVLGAVAAMTTVGGLFLLGRLMSGSIRGAIVAGFMGVMFGTFVFTTGSIWKEMLGLPLLVIALLAYARRSATEFRVLTFVLLMVIPFVHHLVAAVAFIALGYLLAWSLYFALFIGGFRRSHVLDLAMIVIPGTVTATYYATVRFDPLLQITSAIGVVLIVVGFVVMCLVTILILSMKWHSRWSFAPLIGVVLAALLLLDYSGYVFHYTPSATDAYILLALGSAFLVALGWYGSEIIIETRARYRALQLALILSPLTILAFGVIQGLSPSGQKVLYRSFDFLDIFIFLGIGVALVELYLHRKRLYSIIGVLMIFSVTISFPFSYASQSLLGVKHDTQGYELDALEWMADQPQVKSIVSDERISYLVHSVIGIPKDASLPQYISSGTPFPSYLWFYIIEDSWTIDGVNNYPYGEVVVNRTVYDKMLEASDVFYIGGPAGDRLIAFIPSQMGSNTIYGPPT